ncbi:hypothetical protein ACIRP2_15240 [Streptomyces sp. NPDC101194]|uniref:hypothetical protein n=1 Tax=Streptomyces sp. NPDC101194 TaxID=3366127 RepID=UPI0037FEF65D
MELKQYVDSLREDLLVAAGAGDGRTRDLTERLVTPLSSAVRLALLDVLSAAADEITRDLAPGSVEIRLRGQELTFVVSAPPADGALDDAERGFDRSRTLPAPLFAPEPAVPAVQAGGEEGATSRINFRPPEHLKARIEEAAGRERLSVNAWLVRAVSGMVDSDDREHVPAAAGS